MTIVINLFGSAGSGKSTTAMGLTYYLRLLGYKAEYVTEYAKDLVNEGSFNKLKHQLYVFSKQLKRMEVVTDKGLDFIVTDSPIFLSLFYGDKYGTSGPYLKELVASYHKTFVNINVFLKRHVPYDPLLRVQTEEESNQDSDDLADFLRNNNVYLDVSVDSRDENVKWLAEFIHQRKQKGNEPDYV